MSESIRAGLDTLAHQMAEGVAEVKPKLRGWLHLATAPVTLAAGIVLVVLSPTAATRWGSAVYAVCSVLLFTVSATYHRGRWSPRMHGVLQRLDHSSIFLLIAGSYTPFSLLLLRGTDRVVLLTMVWSGALLGDVPHQAAQRLDRLVPEGLALLAQEAGEVVQHASFAAAGEVDRRG